jgi:hypothetical protein
MNDIDELWGDLMKRHANFTRSNEEFRKSLSRLDNLIEAGVQGDSLAKAISKCNAFADDQEEDNREMHLKLEGVLDKLRSQNIIWEPHEDGQEGAYESRCKRFEVSMDPTYGYLRLHNFGDTAESLAEGRSLREMTDAAIKEIESPSRSVGPSGP